MESTLFTNIHSSWLRYIHSFDWSVRSPSFFPTTEHLESIESSKGQKGYTKWQGRKKPPLNNSLLNYYAENACKVYYRSDGSKKTIVLMLDLDRHHSHQTQEHVDQAISWLDRMFATFGSKIKWVKSDRGANGYLFVSKGDTDPGLFNEWANKLAKAISNWLRQTTNPIDFEIKGTCTYSKEGRVHRGVAGKLPIHRPDWTGADALQLSRLPRLSFDNLKRMTTLVEKAANSPQKIEHLIAPPIPALNVSRIRINNLDELRLIADSFERQRQALWLLAKKLQRMPSFSEAINFIRDEDLFTGNWHDNFERRNNRIRSIINWLESVFDSQKLRHKLTVELNLNKYRGWTRRKLLKPLICKRFSLDEGGNSILSKTVYLDWEFLGTSQAIIEYCLLNANQDGSVPQERIKAIFRHLHAQRSAPAWCPLKFKAARELLVKWKHIEIFDRQYGPGKAMRWKFGPKWVGLRKIVKKQSQKKTIRVPRCDQYFPILKTLNYHADNFNFTCKGWSRGETKTFSSKQYFIIKKEEERTHYSLVRDFCNNPLIRPPP